MAILGAFNFAFYLKHLQKNGPARGISSTRRLLSQEWQQQGVPGSNMPFSIKNKYVFTLMTFTFVASGLCAPFIIMREVLLRINTPPEPMIAQQLTTVYCPEGVQPTKGQSRKTG